MTENQHFYSDDNVLSVAVNNAIAGYQHFLIAISGGIDSMVLLHAVWQLQQQRPDITVRAIYIHHGLSEHAQAWGEHCRMICQAWHIPFQLQYVHVDTTAGIEAGARQARYSALQCALQPNEILLTAQHLDDQCETFLLALKRGSGPAGLSGMALDSAFAKTRLVRPLMTIPRKMIEAYAIHHRLDWVNDESNQDRRFERNFLRLEIVPQLRARWPHFTHAVARSAALCAEQEQLLDELLAPELAQIMTDDMAITISALRTMSKVKRQALLRRWLAYAATPMPSRDQLDKIWQEVALAQSDKQPQLKIGDKVIRRYQDRLYFLPVSADISEQSLLWSGEQPLLLPDRLGQLYLVDSPEQSHYVTTLRAPRADEHVSVRFKASGKVSIVGRQHSCALKKIWQTYAVPPWQRTRIPLIYFNEHLAAAIGIFTCQMAQVQEQEKTWHIAWQVNAT